MTYQTQLRTTLVDDVDADTLLLLERDREIQQLQREMLDLHDLTLQMAMLIEEQELPISMVVGHVEESHGSVVEAEKVIQKVYRRRSCTLL